MVKFILSILFFSSVSQADTLIDICDRGEVGNIIALAANSKSCSSVSIEEMAKIQWLDIRRSSALKTIPPDAFQGLASLKTLKIRENSISKIEDYAFRGLNSLENFEIYENFGPLELSEKSLQGIRNVEYLTLARLYNLKALPENVFMGLTKLKRLVIGDTLLRRISKQWFRDLSILEELYLGGNDLDLVSEGTFDNLISLKKLSLSSSIWIAFQGRVFKGLNSLEELSLYNCYLKNIPSFEGLTNLKSLTLSANSLVTISKNDFNGLEKLEYLDLSSNQIGKVTDNTFQELTSLKQLDLSTNQVSIISKSYSGLREGVKVYGVSVIQ